MEGTDQKEEDRVGKDNATLKGEGSIWKASIGNVLSTKNLQAVNKSNGSRTSRKKKIRNLRIGPNGR